RAAAGRTGSAGQPEHCRRQPSHAVSLNRKLATRRSRSDAALYMRLMMKDRSSDPDQGVEWPRTADRRPDGSSDAFPLSAVQRSVWFGQQLNPTAPIFIAQYVELHG